MSLSQPDVHSTLVSVRKRTNTKVLIDTFV